MDNYANLFDDNGNFFNDPVMSNQDSAPELPQEVIQEAEIIQDTTPVQQPVEEPMKATRVKKTKAPVAASPVNNTPNTSVISPEAYASNSLKENLDLLRIHEDYTDQEWAQRASIYILESLRIVLDPTNITGYEISSVSSSVNAVLSCLRQDYAFMQNKAEHYNSILKLKKDSKYTDIKTSFGAAKFTVKDVEAGVATALENEKIYDGLNIIDICERYSDRVNLLKAWISIFEDKKDMLIIYSAALKADVSISNLSPNVPGGRR